MPEKPETASSIGADIVRAFRVPLVLALVLCGIEVVNTLVGHRINALGVHPREPFGLIGLVTMPLLHGSFAHVVGNSITLLLFGTTMMLMRPRGEMLFVSLATAIAAGLFAWCFGAAHSSHVGYSGVLFGYFGYLVAIGFFERKLGSVVLSLLFGAVYGAMIAGVLPGQEGISWEGHAGGFLGGIACAAIVARRGRAPAQKAEKAEKAEKARKAQKP